MRIRWNRIVCAGILAVLLALALKNPYDTQSLIPNLEPYPDSLFYSYPVIHMLRAGIKHVFDTGAWSMQTSFVNPKIVTPPGYSLFLAPFLYARGNILDFFWGNCLLVIGCFGLMWVIARKLFPDSLIVQGLVGLLFATNFYVFTMPSLLMAELITLFMFLVVVYGQLSPSQGRWGAMVAFSTLYLGFIKFSNLALISVLALRDLLPNPRGWKWYAYWASVAIFFIWYSQILVGHKNLQPGASFSHTYIHKNLVFYLKALVGYSTSYLWYQERLLSPLVALTGLCGLGIGLITQAYKKISQTLLLAGSAHVLFMSTFITPDARYISMLIPVIIIGVGICMSETFRRWHVSHSIRIVIITGFLALYLFIPQFSPSQESYAITLKKQIGLNYLHPEQPWNYISVQELNSYFHAIETQQNKKPIYVGTFLPPHYVAYFARGYTPVPLTFDQEFYTPDIILPGKTHSIISMYKYLLTVGDVYITNAYSANNPNIWRPAFETLRLHFETKLVHEGCFGTCNLYKIIKPAPVARR